MQKKLLAAGFQRSQNFPDEWQPKEKCRKYRKASNTFIDLKDTESSKFLSLKHKVQWQQPQSKDLQTNVVAYIDNNGYWKYIHDIRHGMAVEHGFIALPTATAVKDKLINPIRTPLKRSFFRAKDMVKTSQRALESGLLKQHRRTAQRRDKTIKLLSKQNLSFIK